MGLVTSLMSQLSQALAPAPVPDPRHISHGRIVPSGNYADQPFMLVTADGAWLCVMTVGRGREGQHGQHLVGRRSTDQGRTWSEGVALEPPDGPEASYGVLLRVASGRIYCFYNHNTDDVREVRADDPPFAGGWCKRVDTLGHFVFKFTDDHGRTWSPRRYEIPLREFAIDRENPYQGALKLFWNVGRAFAHGGEAFVPLAKVGRLGLEYAVRSEGCLLVSPNLLVESDPERITWETLPQGDVGLRNVPGGGLVAEEHSYTVLSDGSLFVVYRSIDGHPVCSYSRDAGRTWDPPSYLTYADGRRVRHPRAANFAWRCGNGKFLYWFHNHGGRNYEGRNPAWLCGGWEVDSPAGRRIAWSQPEVAVYDDDALIRMSYPDFLEDGGRYFVSETQKNLARVHEIPPDLPARLWGQAGGAETAARGLVLDWKRARAGEPAAVDAPVLPVFVEHDHSRTDGATKDHRAGFTLDCRFRLRSLGAGQVLAGTIGASGVGWSLATTSRGTVELTMCDGQTRNTWDCDQDLLGIDREQRMTVIVDGGPKLILFVVEGALCDGARHREFGWGRFSPQLMHAQGEANIAVDSAMLGLRIYERAISVSEAIGNHRADA